ncbi:MAG: hypothetical protein DRJ03_24310 [Chloroflexi bacterium]|nr:MAG: hypothetical protein DRJ03_24310 [Chloroflexota bacterium]
MSTSCPICLHKDKETLDAIKTAYLDEGGGAEELSVEFGIPYDILLNHLSRCITSGDGTVDGMKDRSDDLSDKYEQLKEAVDMAHNEYLTEPKASNATGYAQLVMQFRGMLLELQQLDSPEKIASELANDIVGPLVSRLITTLTEELHRTREDLIQKTEAHYAKPINTVVTETLKRVGSRLAMDQQEAVIKIQKRFNLEEDDLPYKAKKPGASLH